MTTATPEEQVILGQRIAEKLAETMMHEIDEAITQAVLIGMIPFDQGPAVKRQVWGELALQSAERFRNHGN